MNHEALLCDCGKRSRSNCLAWGCGELKPWKLPAYTWGEERELCKRCAHYRERIGGGRTSERSVVMACALRNKSTGGTQYGTCIDMRYDGPCGRLGLLFKEKAK